jgi:hypothetical protein
VVRVLAYAKFRLSGLEQEELLADYLADECFLVHGWPRLSGTQGF